MNRDSTYIRQIVAAVDRIFSYTTEGKLAFFDSILIQDAVIRNLEIIGEATKRISIDFRNRYPDLPWREMAGLRDVLIHDYESVDLKIVWNVVENELPKLEIRYLMVRMYVSLFGSTQLSPWDWRKRDLYLSLLRHVWAPNSMSV